MKKHRFIFSKESKARMAEYGSENELNRKAAQSDEQAKRPQEAAKTTECVVPPAASAGTAPEPAVPEAAGPFAAVSRTDVGKMRANNEDSVIMGKRLFGVADGMGGHNGGEVASACVRDTLLTLLDDKEPDPKLLKRAIIEANRKVYLQQLDNTELSGMGTTVSVVWVHDVSMYVGHVGDSRVYRLRKGELNQITDDHSLVMEMARSGMITKEEARSHPMRNVITRAVGTNTEVDVDVLQVVREPGDVWLICSDGLHDMVEDDKLRELLLDRSIAKAADLLVKEALDAGGRDNVSLVIVRDAEGQG